MSFAALAISGGGGQRYPNAIIAQLDFAQAEFLKSFPGPAIIEKLIGVPHVLLLFRRGRKFVPKHEFSLDGN
jgi:hypothetical protein